MATFTKRGERWFAQINKRGIRKSKSFDTKAQAKVWATRSEAEIDAGQARGHVASGDSIATLIDRYVAQVKPVKPWGRTKDDCLHRLRRELGEAPRTDAHRSNGDRLCAAPRLKSGAGPVTIAMELTYLGRVLRIARSVWRQDMPKDVIPDAREALKLLGLVGRSQSRDRIATDEEIAAIKREWRSEVPVEIIDFAIDSCMRLGEICRIQWADLAGQVILVRDRKHPRDKIGNHQRVPLLGRCMTILAGVERRNAEQAFPYPEDTVGTAFRRARDAAGRKGPPLPRSAPHRHHAAVQAGLEN